MKTDVWSETMHTGLDLEEVPKRRPPLLEGKIMMVDDDPMMTDLIQTYLEDEGYTNFVATNNPLEALDLLRIEEPAVLLLDLMMPQMSGFELLEAIRGARKLRYTPVIVLTASTSSDSKLRALKLGATDFLSKPVDASELVLRVRNTLAFRQYHEDMVNFDPVTRLPQASLFDRSLDVRLEHNRQHGGALSLLSIQVPECRLLRESIDQSTANDLAKDLSRRLTDFIRRFDGARQTAARADRTPKVARIGEDNFVLLLEGLADAETISTAAQRLIAELAAPIAIGTLEFAPSPSIGIAVAPGDGSSAEALRRSADLAATHASQHGTVHFMFASPALNAKSFQRLKLASELRVAVATNQLRLHYQPKVELLSGRVIGAEALVRWQHPERGLIGPAHFIGLAEELGLIRQLGEWVIERACYDIVGWAAAGLGAIKVSVNVAKQQFDAGDLCHVLRRAIFDTGIPANQLVIELTESMLIDDVNAAIAQMHELKALGITLSIDDFGTGFSSLSYLKRFPMDELKIDRSFVMDLPGGRTDVAIVQTVIELGHNLGMSVTAEGVETEAQLHCLASLGCDACQGFLFSRPLAPEDMAALLAYRPGPG